MNILILFAAWAPDGSENTRRWVDWYINVLNGRFANCDKIMAINYGSDPAFRQRSGEIVGRLDIVDVPEHLHINSDACGLQVALAKARDRLHQYDYILFMHAKGISYSFDAFEPVRDEFLAGIFDQDAARSILSSGRSTLLCQRAHMANHRASAMQGAGFAARLGISAPPFPFAAALTLYYAPAAMVGDLIERAGETFLSTSLAANGFDRFFFEGTFPSALVMLGAVPAFVFEPALDPHLSDSVCYDACPAHNAALVLREFARRCEEGAGYLPHPIPYVFAARETLNRFMVSFSV